MLVTFMVAMILICLERIWAAGNHTVPSRPMYSLHGTWGYSCKTWKKLVKFELLYFSLDGFTGCGGKDAKGNSPLHYAFYLNPSDQIEMCKLPGMQRVKRVSGVELFDFRIVTWWYFVYACVFFFSMLDYGSMCQLYKTERKQSLERLSEAVAAISGKQNCLRTLPGIC